MKLSNTPAPLFIQGGDIPIIKFIVLELGAWNMDTTQDKVIAHGQTLSKILNISGIIIKDGSAELTPIFGYYAVTGEYGCNITSDVTNITISRRILGYFDSVDYDDGAMNRGYVTIQVSS